MIAYMNCKYYGPVNIPKELSKLCTRTIVTIGSGSSDRETMYAYVSSLFDISKLIVGNYYNFVICIPTTYKYDGKIFILDIKE